MQFQRDGEKDSKKGRCLECKPEKIPSYLGAEEEKVSTNDQRVIYTVHPEEKLKKLSLDSQKKSCGKDMISVQKLKC